MNNRILYVPNSHNHEKVFKESIIGNNQKIWQIEQTTYSS